MAKDLIVKSNTLIEACYKLSLQESRLILNLAAQIHPDDSDFKKYTMSIKEIAKVTGVSTNSLYDNIKNVTESLLKKVIYLPKNDNGFKQLAWLCEADYEPGLGKVTLCFSPNLKPFLLNLRERFTSYSLSIAIKFKSLFSFRIYELLKQYENIGKREIKVSDLRKMLGLDDNIYPLYGNFKQKILKVTQKELKEKSDISFDFDEVKEGQGRTVKAIIFFIHKQEFPNADKNKSKEKDEVDVFINELVELLPEKYQKLASYRKLIIKYFEQNGKNYVIRNILYANDKSNDTNYRAYLSKSLEFDYGLAYQEDQEVKKEEAERQRLAKVKEAKQKEFENLKIQKEKENHIKAREIISKLSEQEKSELEAEALEQLRPLFKERYNRNHNDTIASLQIRLNMENLIIQRNPEEFK